MRVVSVAAVLGAAAVVTGALGLHALRAALGGRFEIWETAVRYQLVHALALAAVGLVAERQPSRWAAWSAGLMIAGIALFSGSLYALALGAPRAAGLVTPFGGLALIAGWLALAVAAGHRTSR